MNATTYRLAVHLLGGQSVEFGCSSYRFRREVDPHGHVKQEFTYEPLDGDPERVVFLNVEAVAAIVEQRETVVEDGG